MHVKVFLQAEKLMMNKIGSFTVRLMPKHISNNIKSAHSHCSAGMGDSAMGDAAMLSSITHYFSRKQVKALYIKNVAPSLNIQEMSVPLNIL